MRLRYAPDGAPKPTRKPRTYISIELSAKFGLALRDARLRAELTQKNVAKRAQVSQTYVSRVELGEQDVTLASMARLARAVGLDVSLGITGDDPTPPATQP
jgi:transcriptional regulator with XRE-family HTH domain